MSEVRADVANAFEDPAGVFFHVEMTGRRPRVHVSKETLEELGSGTASGDYARFVQENEAAIQKLVDEGVEGGWTGPLVLII